MRWHHHEATADSFTPKCKNQIGCHFSRKFLIFS